MADPMLESPLWLLTPGGPWLELGCSVDVAPAEILVVILQLLHLGVLEEEPVGLPDHVVAELLGLPDLV
eukprot:8687920-Prorocentrum_lima.AAC.1